MIRHVIFDLDGTLVDSNALCVAILTAMLEQRGSDIRIDPDAARAYMSRGGAEMVAALLGSACGDPVEELMDFRARYARARTPVSSLFPGVADGLATFRRNGLTLSICSNKPQPLCERVLADTGIERHFAAVVGGGPGFRPKPAPDLLDATLTALGASASECLFIGDSELDHAIATEARMPFVFMRYGYAEVEPTSGVLKAFDCFATMTASMIDYLGRRDAA